MKNTILISALFFCTLSFAGDGPWTQKSSIPAQGRHRTSGFSIGNKGYIGLGHYNSGPNGNVTFSDIWEYDPGTDSWTQKADYGGGSTYGAVSFTIGNYAYLGAHVYGAGDFWKFDPIANVWTAISNLPGGSSDQTAFALGDKGYVIAGSQNYEYNPLTDSWTTKSAIPASFWSWSKSFVTNDKAYVIGSSSKAVYEYKPATDEWLYRGIFPGEAEGGWSTFSMEDRGYVVSGYIQFLNPTSRQCWEYNPFTNEWHQLNELPGATRRFSSAFTIDDIGYIGTGTNGTNMNDLWAFDREQAVKIPNENPFTSLAVFPNPSRESMRIELPHLNTDSQIEIYNLQGELLYQDAFLHQVILDKAEVGTGTFIYRIVTQQGIETYGKLIFL